MDTISDRLRRAVAQLNEGPWGKRGGGSPSGSNGGDGGGKDGPRNPWSQPPGGRGPKGAQGPAALDQLFEQMKARFGGGGDGGGSGGGGGGFGGANRGKLIRNALLAFIVLWVIFTSFWRIEPQQEGVITRFGKYAGRLEPGIGMTLPSPIDQVEKVDVGATNTTTIPETEGVNLVLTGDQNIIDLAYSVRWEKSNPEDYLFELKNPDQTLREAAESAMREVISQVTLDGALGPQRNQIETNVAARTQVMLNSYKAGITIRGVSILHVRPPAEVVEAFNQVTVRQQEKQGNINNANLYAKQVIARAEGDAAAFEKVYEQYRLAPEVTRRRMYYDTMDAVLSQTDKTIVEPNAVAPYLPIGGGTKPRVTVEDGR